MTMGLFQHFFLFSLSVLRLYCVNLLSFVQAVLHSHLNIMLFICTLQSSVLVLMTALLSASVIGGQRRRRTGSPCSDAGGGVPRACLYHRPPAGLRLWLRVRLCVRLLPRLLCTPRYSPPAASLPVPGPGSRRAAAHRVPPGVLQAAAARPQLPHRRTLLESALTEPRAGER